MWSKLMDVKNGYVAQVWKDLYDAEGVACASCRRSSASYAWSEPREIWVPDSKTHVAAEIMRKV